MMSVEIGSDLRNLIRRFRTDRLRWGKPRGLSQSEAADKIGKSQVYWRQIETGYIRTAPATTLADMCDMLGIDVGLVRALGYADIAGAMDAITMARDNLVPRHMLDHDSTEAHIRATPGLSDAEIEVLLATLKASRAKVEPLGRDIWRRR